MTSLDTRRLQLEARLAYLKARLGVIDEELDSHETKDWEDLATERERDEVLEGMWNSGVQKIRQIEAALQRIAEGEYGFCTTCGTEIAPKRLDVLPFTPFCRACAH
jgi:RNA polymerase-binding transcription factor DksA